MNPHHDEELMNFLRDPDADLRAWLDDYEAEERRQEKAMGRWTSNAGDEGDFKQAPQGTHVARCVRLIDIGTQRGEYEGKPTRRDQFIAEFEIPGEIIEIDGEAKPLIISRYYTNSLGEKAALRKDLEGWRGRAFTPEELAKFDLENILGKPCLITVIHNKNGRAKVSAITALPKGTVCPPAYNQPSAFWMEPWNDAAFQALSDGVKRMIEASDEFREMLPPGATPPKAHVPDDDEPPF